MLISVVFLTITFPHFPWQGVATEASSGLACEQKWCMPLSDHVAKRKQFALHVLFPPFQRLVSGYSSEWTGFDHEDKNKTLSNSRTIRLKELWSQDDLVECSFSLLHLSDGNLTGDRTFCLVFSHRDLASFATAELIS